MRLEQQAKYLLERGLPFDEPGYQNAVPSGSLLLDYHLYGGYQRSTMTAIIGRQHHTFMALVAVRAAQKCGEACLYCSTHGYFDTPRAKDMGVNLDDLIVLESNSPREIEGAIIGAKSSCGLIVIDTLDGVQTRSRDPLEAFETRERYLHGWVSWLTHPYTAFLGTYYPLARQLAQEVPYRTRQCARLVTVETSRNRVNRLEVGTSLYGAKMNLQRASIPIQGDGNGVDEKKELWELLHDKELSSQIPDAAVGQFRKSFRLALEEKRQALLHGT